MGKGGKGGRGLGDPKSYTERHPESTRWKACGSWQKEKEERENEAGDESELI